MNSKMKNWILIAVTMSFGLQSLAHEGMWIPSVLGAVHDEMQGMGLKLTEEDLYSINNSSLKDAVVLFGGGCTAEVVSNEGLIFTNHHCGFDYVQFHSSLKHDYLKNGFWAMNRNEELICKGLTATFVVSMEDVTKSMLDGITSDMVPAEADKIKAANKKKLEDAAKLNGLSAVVRAFNYGNQYFLIVTKTFSDVRLVGAPPSEIGKFGGDTDNWVWPRHTGDFSVFRIYADGENKPSEYNEANVPFKPAHFFPISLKGAHEGDFSMVYGFPGRTEHFLTSYAVDYAVNKSNKMRIEMRSTSLGIIDGKMRSSDALRIKYAAKQSDISNAYKKWIGQGLGLTRFDAIDVKKKEESEFTNLVKTSKNPQDQEILPKLQRSYSEYEKYNMARDGFVEYVFYGPEIFAFAKGVNDMMDNMEKWEKDGTLKAKKEELLESTRLFYKNFDLTTEKEIFTSLTPLYKKHVDTELGPGVFDTYILKGSMSATADRIYGKSIFRDSTLVIKFINALSTKSKKKASKDPILAISRSLYDVYSTSVTPKAKEFSAILDSQMSLYVKRKQEVMPSKNYWNDANSTLRISFGKVEGSAPHDGSTYTYFTTADGILDKYMTANPDFQIGDRMKQLLESRDYGNYGEGGELRVCYTGSNHTTGGNSGSPALNGSGELVGINFDRSWESTMSDIYYSPEICRNIMVDIRYVLWVIDVYANADYLLQEMKLMK